MTPTLRSIAALSTLLAAAVAAPARAQDAGPPPNTCEKPGDFAPLDKQSPQMTRFQKRLDDYKQCISQYSKAQGAKGEELSARGRAYTEAANQAINEYNAYATELNLRNSSTDSSGAAKTPPPAPSKY